MDDVTREQPVGLHRLHHVARQLGPLRWLLLTIMLIAVASLALGIYSFVKIHQQADLEKARANEAVATAEELCEQVRALGRECVKDPEALRGETGPAGERGPPPSDEAIRRAVEAYFLEHPPAAGPAPTPVEIATAVITYLTENPPAAGPPGPPPSDEQIAQAVASWFVTHPLPVCLPGTVIATVTVLTPGGHQTIITCVQG